MGKQIPPFDFWPDDDEAPCPITAEQWADYCRWLDQQMPPELDEAEFWDLCGTGINDPRTLNYQWN